MRNIIIAIAIMLFAYPVLAQCDVDYYSTRPDGGLGYDGAVGFIVCPLSCPADTTASNVDGSWQCVGLGSFDLGPTVCGNGLPCGQIPWSLPALEVLASPTPISDFGFAASANPETTPDPEATPLVEADEIGDAVNDFDSLLTPVATPSLGVDESVEYDNLIQNSAMFFSYVRAVELMDFGVLSPLITFIFITFSLTILLNVTLFALPIITMLFGVLRKLVDFIMPVIRMLVDLVMKFIPGF